MEYESEALKSLFNLSSSITTLKTHTFPSLETKDLMDTSLALIKRYSDGAGAYENLSEKRIKYLQALLDAFYSDRRKNIKIIIKKNSKYFDQIIFSMDKLFVNGKALSAIENIDNLTLLFEKMRWSISFLVANYMMKYYLLPYNHENDDIKEIIIKIFTKLRYRNDLYITDLNLYTDTNYLLHCLSIAEVNYTKTLTKAGILPVFIGSDFFIDVFFEWFFYLNKIHEDILFINKKYFNVQTTDKKKLIFSKYICEIYKKNKIETVEKYLNKIEDELSIDSNIDKTEENYWLLSNEDLKTKENIKLLKQAYRIVLMMFNRDIIDQFFEIVGDKDETTKQRAGFWRDYCTSSQFKDIKFVVTTYQRNELLKKINIKDQNLIYKYLIKNTAISESPVLLISFERKSIAEFLETNNATQVYNTNEEVFQNNFNAKNIQTISIFKIHKNSAFKSVDGVGKIIHRNSFSGFGWQERTKRFLRKYGIK